jgi:glycerol-3-phosphate acyltransferase PlsX
MRIGLDAMGGDFAPKAAVEGAILAQKELPTDHKIVLIGDKPQIVEILNQNNSSESDFEIVHTTQVVEMGDNPTKAFASKQDSSIAVGFGMLQKGLIDGFASAGNTGAMFVGTMFTVKTVPGVLRPCLITPFPQHSGGNGVILDAGANADCKPEFLNQFAIFGSLYAQEIYKINNPRVALLNVGEEKSKGNTLYKATHELLDVNDKINFIGNVESSHLFNDTTDVMVCDGFTGNIVLKQAEAMYWMMKDLGHKSEFFDKLNHENHGGSPILGAAKTVMIGHGVSGPPTIKSLIKLTKDLIIADLASKIEKALN